MTIFSHLIYCIDKNDITNLYVNGNALMKNKKLTTIDEEEVIAVAKNWQKQIKAN